MLTTAELKRLRADVTFNTSLLGSEWTFRTTWGLFSPRAIDEGTHLLLDRLEISPTDNCLDLGCGYGPIGLSMARQAPQGKTLMLDKDFVAVRYSNLNAENNGIKNAEAILSNGFDQVDKNARFDLIASNIPAKVGKEMMSLILHDALHLLNPGGRLYLVTINGLRQYMKRNLNEVFGNYDKLKQGKSYTVALAIKEG
ncbi:MAG: methyltransferase [Candidatus Polarisedimenticolaceae bacterium]|nr:methyltransferase [Candidatus Polarisedimenticolaceae bacterium]